MARVVIELELDRLELGTLIRKRRKELGLTLSDLANERISVPTLSNIERGTVYRVSEDNLAYIMDRLDLTEERLQDMQQQSKELERSLGVRLSRARHLIELKLYEEAREELNALEQEESLDDDPYHRISLQLQKGVLYRKLQQWERAKRALHQVIRLAQESDSKKTNDLTVEAYQFLSLCAFYGDQDYEKAIEYADAGLNIYEENAENLYMKGRTLYNKANYYFHLGRYGEAYKYIKQAQEISEQTHDIRILIYAYNLEGLIYSKQKMYNNAIQKFEKAIALSRKYYFVPDTACFLYLNLSDTYYHKEAYDEALYHIQIAHRLCQITGDQNMHAIVYYTFAEIYYKLKDLSKADAYVEKATELAKKVELTSEYLGLLALKAHIALDRQSKDVLNICQEGIKRAEQTKLYDKKKEFHFLLAKYHEYHGNTDQFAQETENLFRVEKLIKGGI